MLKTIYCVEKHTYWEHYGARPNVYEYDTKEAAEEAANKYEHDNFLEDGCYAVQFSKEVLVRTDEEEALHEKRVASREVFDLKKEAYAYGIYTFWDGHREPFYIIKDKEHILVSYICFQKKGKIEAYRLASHLDYFQFDLKGKWCLDDTENMIILGGLILRLPKICQYIDTVQLNRPCSIPVIEG